MKNPNVRLTKEHYNSLMKISKETGASIAFQVRKALDAFLKKEAKK